VIASSVVGRAVLGGRCEYGVYCNVVCLNVLSRGSERCGVRVCDGSEM